MAVVRPKDRVAVRHPSGNGYVGLDPTDTYDPSDPLVKAYPDHFEADGPDKKSTRGKVVESATANPGEKRARSK